MKNRKENRKRQQRIKQNQKRNSSSHRKEKEKRTTEITQKKSNQNQTKPQKTLLFKRLNLAAKINKVLIQINEKKNTKKTHCTLCMLQPGSC